MVLNFFCWKKKFSFILKFLFHLDFSLLISNVYELVKDVFIHVLSSLVKSMWKEQNNVIKTRFYSLVYIRMSHWSLNSFHFLSTRMAAIPICSWSIVSIMNFKLSCSVWKMYHEKLNLAWVCSTSASFPHNNTMDLVFPSFGHVLPFFWCLSIHTENISHLALAVKNILFWTIH